MKEKLAKEKEALVKETAPLLEQIPVEDTEIKSEPTQVETQDSGIVSETVSIVSQEEIACSEEQPKPDEPATLPLKVDSEPMEVDVIIEEETKTSEHASEQPSIDEIKEPEPIEREVEVEEEELTPFQELIRVASLLNPKQFDLPVEMTEPFPFPGTERVEQIKNGRRVKNKRLIELDVHGCVPLPAKLCYACSKSCKKAPLISCDYCTLFFHQDCLDPPMTALPAGRWMCPNHPQHFIVSSIYSL